MNVSIQRNLEFVEAVNDSTHFLQNMQSFMKETSIVI